MSLVIYFFGSGLAFFAGVALVLIGVATTLWRPGLRVLPSILGLVLLALSAAPLSWWFWLAAGTATVTWLVAEDFQRKISRRWLIVARTGIATLWLSAAAVEMPYQVVPAVDISGRPSLWVMGDSVTAGMGNLKTATWPGILSRAHGIDVHDLSQPGATVAACRRLESELLGDGIVLLEIGGNDLLGSTTAAEFEQRLDALFALLCRPGRAVLMFELPLPPLSNAFGLAQRRLAARYGVLLIPKRVFAAVLTASDATVDGVHLTPHGHELMAECVWSLIGSAYLP
jgi:acyl-CoA thioesterase-1